MKNPSSAATPDFPKVQIPPLPDPAHFVVADPPPLPSAPLNDIPDLASPHHDRESEV